MPLPGAERISRIELTEEFTGALYAERVRQLLRADDPGWDYLVILDARLSDAAPGAIERLVSFLQLPGVCMASGRIVSRSGALVHTGLVHRPSGIPLAVYAGFPQTEPGYMAVTRILRNVSAPHPLCCALRRDVWECLGGLDSGFNGPHALLDLALRALEQGLGRCVYAPEAGFMAHDGVCAAESWPVGDRVRFAEKWQTWLRRGDPYYSPVLSLTRPDMSLKEHY
jgi:GT2 family glycosyltransferase